MEAGKKNKSSSNMNLCKWMLLTDILMEMLQGLLLCIYEWKNTKQQPDGNAWGKMPSIINDGFY